MCPGSYTKSKHVELNILSPKLQASAAQQYRIKLIDPKTKLLIMEVQDIKLSWKNLCVYNSEVWSPLQNC